MRAVPPALPDAPPVSSGETPIDRAIALSLANELYAALRWTAAIVKRDPAMATALALVGRLLGELGHREAARTACEVAVERSIDVENLPLAVTAAHELARFGGEADKYLDLIADSFCKGSPRLGEGAPPPPPLPQPEDFAPLPNSLTGHALVKEAVTLVEESKRLLDAVPGKPRIAPLQLFSAMGREGLRALCASATSRWLRAGQTIVEEGTVGHEAFFVGRGDLEVHRRKSDGAMMVLARLTNGAIFGEMALLARAPRAASVTATRPSIVIEVKRDALEEIVSDHPEVATELANHCRERMFENLLRASDLLSVVPDSQRAVLVERFTTRIFETKQHIIVQGERPAGLYLIASGEVAVVRREDESGSDPLVLSTLGAGDVIGEVAMVLRRKASADVIALHPTITLFLSTEQFMGLLNEHPAILAHLYVLAVHRDEETRTILQEEASVAEDFVLI
jgi:cAMP-dependent protein kinase regulator